MSSVLRNITCEMSRGRHVTLFALCLLLPQYCESTALASFALYSAEPGKRCSGGTSSKIGDIQSTLEDCSRLCSATTECFGLNWIAEMNNCVARSAGCVIEDSEKSVFYRKQPTNDTSMNYEMLQGKRCTGGPETKVGEVQQDIQGCARLCDDSGDCFGFDFDPSTSRCNSKKMGCKIEDDPKVNFYKRISEATTASATTSGKLNGYSVIHGTRCKGGTSRQIGETSDSIQACLSMCDMDADCAGINWQISDHVCIVRTFGCIKVDDSSAIFYEKDQQQKTESTTSTASADVEIAFRDFWGFELELETRCMSEDVLLIVMSFGQLNVCVRECQNSPLCIGFEVALESMICYLKSSGCKKERNADYVFYRMNSGVTFTTVAVTKDLSTGFSRENGTRCVRGTSVAIVTSDNIEDCISLCLTRDDCVGFNWIENLNRCTARTFGCFIANDTEGDFFRKIEATTIARTSSSSTKSSTTMVPTTATAQTTRMAQMATLMDYQFESGRACSGEASTKIGSVQEDLHLCAVLCEKAPDCIGFNWFPNTETCVASNIACVFVEDVNTNFYRKKMPVAAKIPEQTTTIGKSFFNIHSGQRCVAGSSRAVVTGLKGECAAQCLLQIDCIGYNFMRTEGRCVARTFGCEMLVDEDADFYQKLPLSSSTENTKTASLTTSSSTTRTTQVTNDSPAWIDGYVMEVGKRCAGGSSISFAIARKVGQCIEICNTQNDCSGVNVGLLEMRCVARTIGCIEQADESYVFYRKIIPATITTPTSVNPTSIFRTPVSTSISIIIQISTSTSAIPTLTAKTSNKTSPPSASPNFTKTKRTSQATATESSPSTAVRTTSLTAQRRATDAMQQLSTERLKFSEQFMQAVGNYHVIAFLNCTEGNSSKIWEISDRIEDCAKLCNERDDCYGFNWQSGSGRCTARTTGCLESFDIGTIFYRKLATSNNQATTTETILYSLRSTTNKDVEDWEASLLLPSFEVRMGQTCTGDSNTQIGEVQSDARKCGSMCEARSDCYGFTWFPRNGTCIVRTSQCSVVSDNLQTLLYRKARPRTTTTSTLQTPSPLLSSFAPKSETRCAGGTSDTVGLSKGLNNCLSLCYSNAQCYGFNFLTSTEDCALRTANCEEQTATGLVFYLRKN